MAARNLQLHKLAHILLIARITVSTYLELFQESESNQECLLKYDGAKDLRRDGSIQRPVISTWQISFDQIRRAFPAATDLLALMSMFDRQGIPEDLVNRGKNRLTFEDTIAPLMLLPHLKELMQFLVESDKDDLLNDTRIARRCGWYIYLMGKYEEAEVMYRRALTGYEKVLGADHPDTLMKTESPSSEIRR
ncbi:hypothetical protein EYZ11_010378 [Aspergillus tanneri]|uniref:Kinesin light chain n=1 Tax=Aspergillus tanneri TaxID=1220188 RepID=A0A4S3JAV8_9EURO|nr:hypothetical protein EYZ11_010378 [Aspergillus tanneri]